MIMRFWIGLLLGLFIGLSATAAAEPIGAYD
jgi:hypothetical protein